MSARRTGREFLVDVAQLRKQPGSRRQVAFEGEIPDLAISASRVPEGEQLKIDLTLESVSGGILVSGTVDAHWTGECRRCLESAIGPLHVEVLELCEPNPVDEELSYRLGHDELDLLPIVHDACILELPLAPLCREDCLGLCPVCGANRNVVACSCTPPKDNRFAALEVLVADEPEGDDEPET
jgi:uncharacterized protein